MHVCLISRASSLVKLVFLFKARHYEGWTDPSFMVFFVLSSTLGFLLNYSAILCTKHNSPLTTSVIGCLKNIFVTYIGMFIGGDYKFSLINFIGLSLRYFNTRSLLIPVFQIYLIFSLEIHKARVPASCSHSIRSFQSKPLKRNQSIQLSVQQTWH